ncbi:Uncharacterized protein FWK35_00012723 [Aphis craccivora]|uniref:Uncharacterized protein n=1 Tax=Aphis craccivora TaxID=307492 RepID=A0A6G0ZDR4_APHCR|nr:Uncharacterized protein FWK35_00012723 [Aphis craccivora]
MLHIHLAQSWFRRIQKSSKWLKYFFGLPYLPPDEIEIAFSNLIAIAPPDLLYFSDCFFIIHIT